jgi:hypothetical protein
MAANLLETEDVRVEGNGLLQVVYAITGVQ